MLCVFAGRVMQLGKGHPIHKYHGMVKLKLTKMINVVLSATEEIKESNWYIVLSSLETSGYPSPIWSWGF
jgi:hypothetical protein